MHPLFSVIIATYNRENTILRAINSVLNQSFEDFELLIIDDGSTDSTAKLISKIHDERVKYYYKKNEERNIARNYGIDKSKGDYLVFLDSDDEFLSNHLKNIKEYISKIEGGGVIITNYKICNGMKTMEYKIPTIRKQLLIEKNPIVMGSICIKKSYLSKTIRFIPSKNVVVGEDHYLWLILFSRYNFFYSDSCELIIHENNERSLRNIDVNKLVLGQNEIMEFLGKDVLFLNVFENIYSRFKVNSYLFIGLNLAGTNQSKSIKYLIKAIIINPIVAFQRKSTWALIRNIIFKRIYQ